MGYICTRCGGTNVACEAIVNPNTGKIIDYFDGSFAHAICGDCENEVIISDIEEVKHEIDLRFHEFIERTGREPEYVECLNGVVFVHCIPFEGNECLLGITENPEKK